MSDVQEVAVVTAFADEANSPDHKMEGLRSAIDSLDDLPRVMRGLGFLAYMALDELATKTDRTVAVILQEYAANFAGIVEEAKRLQDEGDA